MVRNDEADCNVRYLVFCLIMFVMAPVMAQPDGYGDWRGQPPSSSEGSAPPARTRQVKSGTGFFVSNVGHIITNEHVVRGCREVSIRGAVSQTTAVVEAVNQEFDLAILQTNVRPPRIANLRQNKASMQVSDPVMVIGYPLHHGATGRYKVERSIILGLEGPQDEPHWVQFSDAALQGNSGGPLLDSSGNVVGVIVGKTKLVRKNAYGEEEVVKKADVAISLPVLKKFLHEHQVYFRYARSASYYSIDRVENIAKDYIVNIHCDAAE